ncbi:MAG: TIGR01777 family oxidoreductase [Desulfobacterales bacterium]
MNPFETSNMAGNSFTKRSRISAPVEEVFKWHARPGAIERLSPPWDPLKILIPSEGIQKGSEVLLEMKAGSFPFKWLARHTEYQENKFFQDRQIRGPFTEWVHSHRFEPDGENACLLEDHIKYKLPFHFISGFPSKRIIQKKLERIFTYRHQIIQRDISLHLKNKSDKPLTIIVTGASGVIGSTLVPFLTTGGHRVIRLVRNRSESSPDELLWDPLSGFLNADSIEEIDAVIHLAGENIGSGRWTPEKKKKIIESRVKGTELVVKKLSSLRKPPKVIICASAIGYYGDRGNNILNENDECGADFTSSVCRLWEKAAHPARERNIRTVFLRIGIVLTPLGGALKRLLLPFKLCVGGKIGNGSQYMSWIDMEDVLGSIYHILKNEAIEGPVNIVAPNPVTNTEFTKTLGKVLARPALFTIPSAAIKMAFGEMGQEILLASTRVMPEKLLKTGYRFNTPCLETALRQMLGRV